MPGLYILPSCWLLDAAAEDVWEVVAGREMSWPQWWPGCTLVDLSSPPVPAGTDPVSILLATSARLQFRAALGYRLTITISPTAAVYPRVIEFDAGGDLRGTGRITLSADGQDAGRTRMSIDWRVTPTRRWMQLLTPVARPAFTLAHSLLMRRGEKGLGRELRRRNRGELPRDQATGRGRPNSVRTPAE